MLGIVLLIFFVAGSRQISITEFSIPDAVESGGDVLLQCGYELSPGEVGVGLTVKWWFTPFNESDDERVQLYQRIAGQPPATTKVDIEIKGNDDILLKNVSPESTGTYECEVSALEDEKRQNDDLIVYSKGEMLLNVTEVEDGPDEDEDSDVLITCDATGVAPYPDLIILVNDEVQPSNDTVVEQEDNTYDVSSIVLVSREAADGADISCELFYNNANITHDQYKIVQSFKSKSTVLSTTEDLEEVSTTEATPNNRVIATSSCLLLVISALFCNIFIIKY